MKTLIDSLLQKMPGIRLFLIISLLFVASCDTNNEEPVPILSDVTAEISDVHAKKVDIPYGIIYLEGFAHFRLYLVKTNEWFMNASVPATATLEHVEGKNYILNLAEFIRDIPYPTTITPAGILECAHPVPFDCYDPFDMTWFDNPVEQLEYTTGFALSGPGINKGTLVYKGTFDGETLLASTHFTGIQEKFGTAPIYQQVLEGPLQFEFAWELTVAD